MDICLINGASRFTSVTLWSNRTSRFYNDSSFGSCGSLFTLLTFWTLRSLESFYEVGASELKKLLLKLNTNLINFFSCEFKCCC